MLAIDSPAGAHPLGNFTINHLAKVRMRGDRIAVRYVLDIAEIPTFQIMRSHSANSRMDGGQLRAWAQSEIPIVRSGLQIESMGTPTALVAGSPRVMTRPGAGGLPTLYWSIDFRGALPAGSGPRRIVVRDRTYAERIGWRDIVVYPAFEPTNELRHYPNALLASPRDVSSIVITTTSRGATVTVPKSEPSTAVATASQVRSNTLSDMLAAGPSSALFVLLTLLVSVGLGALHAMEPGHGKTLLAVSLVGARATPKQAIILATALTAAHTAGVLALGAALLLFAARIVPETIYPWITLGSGIAVAIIGAGALARFVRARRGEAHEHYHRGGDNHNEHGHNHGRALDGDRPLSFGSVVLAATSGNVAPCPAALVVLLTALTLHQLAFGLAIVIAFSVGLAAVLTGLGIALVRGAKWLSARPTFDRLARLGPLVSACVIVLIGAVMVGKGAQVTIFHAPALLVSAVTLCAIAGYAFAPGHSHAIAVGPSPTAISKGR